MFEIRESKLCGVRRYLGEKIERIDPLGNHAVGEAARQELQLVRQRHVPISVQNQEAGPAQYPGWTECRRHQFMREVQDRKALRAAKCAIPGLALRDLLGLATLLGRHSPRTSIELPVRPIAGHAERPTIGSMAIVTSVPKKQMRCVAAADSARASGSDRFRE